MTGFVPETRIGFIGAGAVGGALAVCLSQAGYTVVAVASRTAASAQELARRLPGCTAYAAPQQVVDDCALVFISTPDDAIQQVATALTWRAGQGVVHCSGATSLDVFAHPVRQGAVPGAWHPFQAFATVENAVQSLPGTTFGIEGNEAMRASLATMTRAIGGQPVFLNAEDKVLYHLTAVMMGNLLTGLAATAAQLWEGLGQQRADGVQAIVPMMQSVTHNLAATGLPAAVTGPYVRGDLGTIRKHLETLRLRAPAVLPLYCELALAALPFAVEKQALSAEKARDIRELVKYFQTL
jgi:predicted short-subunit dehydrogenase-like oxidoreductase (DUF2520 family)